MKEENILFKNDTVMRLVYTVMECYYRLTSQPNNFQLNQNLQL